jgi:hypothetical protein
MQRDSMIRERLPKGIQSCLPHRPGQFLLLLLPLQEGAILGIVGDWACGRIPIRAIFAPPAYPGQAIAPAVIRRPW